MSLFVDTSGIVAMMVDSDEAHEAATRVWRGLVSAEEHLVTTSYSLSETYAVLQRLAGMGPLRVLTEAVVPVLDVYWVDRETHNAGVNAFLLANRRDLSLVDCVSFVVMRDLGLRRAFTVDPHFADQGFEVIPAPLLPPTAVL